MRICSADRGERARRARPKFWPRRSTANGGRPEEPCNECEACRKISDGSVMDVVEIDAASNRGVEEIRDLRENVKYAPSEVRCKVFIIDEVHMLDDRSFQCAAENVGRTAATSSLSWRRPNPVASPPRSTLAANASIFAAFHWKISCVDSNMYVPRKGLRSTTTLCGISPACPMAGCGTRSVCWIRLFVAMPG